MQSRPVMYDATKPPVVEVTEALLRVQPHAVKRDRFYFWIALTIAIVVGVGFLPTINSKLFHPATSLPPILYIHAAVFTAWVVLFFVQAALVMQRRVPLHRRLGKIGAVLGGLIPVVGILTALAMTKFSVAQGRVAAERLLILPLFDMLAFTAAFALALYWRARPEFHRRSMLIATCGLTAAAFARFPNWLVPRNYFYIAVDALILAGVARDWLATHRIHAVYRYGLPALIAGQSTVMWILVSRPPTWLAIAHSLVRLTS